MKLSKKLRSFVSKKTQSSIEELKSPQVDRAAVVDTMSNLNLPTFKERRSVQHKPRVRSQRRDSSQKNQSIFKRKTRYDLLKVNEKDVKQLFSSLFVTKTEKPQVRPHKVQSCNFPNILIDTLYRQNIKNYNPYIETLDQLEEEAVSLPLRERIEHLCYLGIAKAYLKTKKYAIGPTYSRVNVLIRTYMREMMCEQVKEKSQNYENIIFLPVNPLALSFNGNHYPNQIADIYSVDMFQEVIRKVNNIISTEYVKYKINNSMVRQELWYEKLLLYCIAIMLLVYAFTNNTAIVVILFSLMALWIVLSGLGCKASLEKIVHSKNATDNITNRLTAYLSSIKTDRIQWKVGTDFYWLEVHYIKRKKPRQQSDRLYQ